MGYIPTPPPRIPTAQQREESNLARVRSDYVYGRIDLEDLEGALEYVMRGGLYSNYWESAERRKITMEIKDWALPIGVATPLPPPSPRRVTVRR